MADQVGMKLRFSIVSMAIVLAFEIGLSQTASQSVIAEIVGEFPYVYEQPDFDSPMIATLKSGTFYYVSKQQYPFGFHKVQLQKNQSGYVSSSEIKLVSQQYVQQQKKIRSNPKAAAELEEKEKKKDQEKAANTKPIYLLRYRGVIVEQQSFTEDTMSKSRSEPLMFFGYRQLGYNTLFSGEMSTDASILFHSGAPKYYQEITKQAADGWIINAHFTFDTIIPLSHSHMASYGFGPMVKYSHFETYLKNTTGGGTTGYNLDDLTLGVLFRVGYGFRWRQISLRTDIKYFIESHRYLSLNLSTLFVF